METLAVAKVSLEKEIAELKSKQPGEKVETGISQSEFEKKLEDALKE